MEAVGGTCWNTDFLYHGVGPSAFGLVFGGGGTVAAWTSLETKDDRIFVFFSGQNQANDHLHIGGHEDGAVHASAGLEGQQTAHGQGLVLLGHALDGQIDGPGLVLGRQVRVVGHQGLHGRHVDLSGRAVQLCHRWWKPT